MDFEIDRSVWPKSFNMIYNIFICVHYLSLTICLANNCCGFFCQVDYFPLDAHPILGIIIFCCVIINVSTSHLQYKRELATKLGRYMYTGIISSVCPSVIHIKFSKFFSTQLQIFCWFYVCRLAMLSLRSCFEFYAAYSRVMVLGLKIFMKILVFRIFFRLIMKILKWNLAIDCLQ
jgi:hypothetical protein